MTAWAEQVPETFRFVMKATRRITHFKRLKGVEEETEYFLEIAAHLEARLGPKLAKRFEEAAAGAE